MRLEGLGKGGSGFGCTGSCDLPFACLPFAISLYADLRVLPFAKCRLLKALAVVILIWGAGDGCSGWWVGGGTLSCVTCTREMGHDSADDYLEDEGVYGRMCGG